MRLYPAACAVPLLALAAHAAPAAASELADTRCLLVLESLSRKATQDQQKQQLAAFKVFYMGKLLSRNPAYKPQTYIPAHKSEIGAVKADVELKRCLAEVQAGIKTFAGPAKK